MKRKESGRLETLLKKIDAPFIVLTSILLLLHFSINEPATIDLGLEMGFLISYLLWLTTRLIVIGLQIYRGRLTWFELRWAIGTGIIALAVVIFLAL